MRTQAHRQAIIAALIRSLRGKRLEQGLSATEIAARAGLNHATILRIEGGERIPTIDTLLRITDALGCSLSTLLEAAVDSVAENDR